MKVGSSKVEKTDVRVIAATNVNLAYAVATGKFREDLYYRLTGIQITVPALRDRNKDDIYLLFRKFTSDFAAKYNLCRITLTHDAINMLTSYRWPGNIRQLKNIAEAITGVESRPITPTMEKIEIPSTVLARYLPDEKDSLIPAIGGPQGGASAMSDKDKEMIVKAILDLKAEVDYLKRIVESGEKTGTAPQIMDYSHPEPEEQINEPEPADLSMKKMSDELLDKVLAKYNGKVKPAAAELGISERTIYRKLAERKTK